MKKFASIMILLFVLISVSACTDDKRAEIVTTMFPQYDFAKQIVRDKMTVSILIPPGAEIHDYEATSKDMVAINEAKLFIFTSLEIDTWIKDISSFGGENTVVLNLSESYTLADDEHEDDDNHLNHQNITTLDTDDHDHEEDIHFWTDPTTAIQLIEAILEKIILIDPENASFYEANAYDYIHELEELHHEIDEFFEQEAYHDAHIFFAGHNAMESFADRYHIHIVSLFPDFKPDAQLTSADRIRFVNEVKQSGTQYLFIEELVEPRAAKAIQEELAKENYTLILLELHGYHNVTKADMEDGVTYLELLSRNFENLKIALGAPTE
ncbi:metal ABC transporter substrate-binding protein [Peloplasma aerotolerans]|uniref:Metal ABC transporter substrate-binding protein n=1 Tax=Peloplasma aerotolerans TaxID=3044389 RepID=A0AAW6U5Z0_9MOLU|nr:metal ABC transporter substrate-binding protein [Mariniplasma sp. M4Ah]MDI6453396.1 metal ABC transporter substrate-binding protein [Mariniplasma sp. M4Ah]